MSGEEWLQTRRLSKHFGAVVALHEIHLQIGLGQVVALVGDNGADKSTLVKLLTDRQSLYPQLNELEEINRHSENKDHYENGRI